MKSVTEEMIAPWTEITLPNILSRYTLENIFHADKCYQCLPNKILHLKGKKCSGGELSKVWLTALAAGNAYGERLPMFVIRKSIKLRSLKGVKTFLCRYRTHNKSWMSQSHSPVSKRLLSTILSKKYIRGWGGESWDLFSNQQMGLVPWFYHFKWGWGG